MYTEKQLAGFLEKIRIAAEAAATAIAAPTAAAGRATPPSPFVIAVWLLRTNCF